MRAQVCIKRNASAALRIIRNQPLTDGKRSAVVFQGRAKMRNVGLQVIAGHDGVAETEAIARQDALPFIFRFRFFGENFFGGREGALMVARRFGERPASL